MGARVPAQRDQQTLALPSGNVSRRFLLRRRDRRPRCAPPAVARPSRTRRRIACSYWSLRAALNTLGSASPGCSANGPMSASGAPVALQGRLSPRRRSVRDATTGLSPRRCIFFAVSAPTCSCSDASMTCSSPSFHAAGLPARRRRQKPKCHDHESTASCRSGERGQGRRSTALRSALFLNTRTVMPIAHGLSGTTSRASMPRS